MKNMFSAGELAKFQNISKQTLIFYDKIGLFRPAYTDPQNNYRYYSADQLDMLDTILIMKKIGFTLSEIRQHMKNYTTETSLAFFRQQLTVLESRIEELMLIKNRLEHRCEQVEKAVDNPRAEPQVSQMSPCEILFCPVEAPYSMREISIATKKCYAQAFSEDLPIFFQCGVSVPLNRILAGRCTEASTAFLTTEPGSDAENIQKLPGGLTASIYHRGSYYEIATAYQRLLRYCEEQQLEIVSDSYEFCINDYITSRDEDEFITKILFYVKPRNP